MSQFNSKNPGSAGDLADILTTIQTTLSNSSDLSTDVIPLVTDVVATLAHHSSSTSTYVSVIAAVMKTIATAATPNALLTGGGAPQPTPDTATVLAATQTFGSEIINYYSNGRWVGQGALILVAAINAIKSNSSDTNAASNADALTEGLLNSVSDTTFGFSDSASISTMFANTNCVQPLPEYVVLVLANNTTKRVDFGDPLSSFVQDTTTAAYYIPLQANQSYTILPFPRQINISAIYDPSNAYLTNAATGTSYTLTSVVPFGFTGYTLNVLGTVGFSNPQSILLQNVSVQQLSSTSASVSWTVPDLGGLALASIRVIPVINTVPQSAQLIDPNQTTYTQSGLSIGDVIYFVVSMIDTKTPSPNESGAFTSNPVTISNNTNVPCFPKGTPIATPTGYKAIDTLKHGDLVLTSDGRQIPIRLFGKYFPETTERTAPYFIPKNTFGPSVPAADLTLSPDHAFLLRKGVWMLPRTAAKLSNKVRQIGVGYPIHYFNLECPNYLRDNLLVNGATVESYGGKTLNFANPYTWSEKLRGYTRPGYELTEVKPEKQSKQSKQSKPAKK